MKRSGTLGLGLALCVIAGAIALAPSSGVLVGWLVRLWPVLPMLVGIASLVGFALKRQPRRPWFGALLLVFGALALPVTLLATANPLVLFGRYWPVVVVVVALVEVLRQYTHRPEMGERPPLFSAGKVALVSVIAIAGLGANRLAEANPNALANVGMPKWLGNVRDDIFGAEFTFNPLVRSVELPENGSIAVTNRFGTLTVEPTDGRTVQVEMIPTVRAYDQASADAVFAQLALNVESAGGVVTIGSNRDAIEQRLTTNMTIRVPKSAALRIDQSHGSVTLTGVEPGAAGITVTGSHASVFARNVRADMNIENAFETVDVASCSGALAIAGRNDVKVTGHSGPIVLTDSDSVRLTEIVAPTVELRSVDRANVTIENVGTAAVDASAAPPAAGAAPPAEVSISGEHTGVTIKSVRGNVSIQTSNDNVRANDITGRLDVKASHCRVDASNVGSLSVQTDHEPVRVKNVGGSVVVDNDHGEVTITDFAGAATVRTSYDPVRLSAASGQAGDVIVENERGDVDVRLPADRTYRFETSGGEARIDPSFVRAADGAAPQYRVAITTSSNEDITIRPVAAKAAATGPAAGSDKEGES